MKIYKNLLCFVIFVITLFFFAPNNIDGATNPYKKWQNYKGVTNIACTWFAWEQANDNGSNLPMWSHSGSWLYRAKKDGYSVGTVAKPNSIAVYTGEEYGHVAYVVSVNGNKMTVNEGGMRTSKNGIVYGNTYSNIVGTYRYSLKLIGFIYLDEPRNHPHEFTNWQLVKDSTCETTGIEMRSCSCGHTETRTVPLKNHTLTEWKLTHSPSLTEEGIEERHCEVCSYKEEKNTPKLELNVLGFSTTSIKSFILGEGILLCIELFTILFLAIIKKRKLIKCSN